MHLGNKKNCSTREKKYNEVKEKNSKNYHFSWNKWKRFCSWATIKQQSKQLTKKQLKQQLKQYGN